MFNVSDLGGEGEGGGGGGGGGGGRTGPLSFISGIFPYHGKQCYGIGDFRVAFRLCFKASPSKKPFIWKLVLFTRKFWFMYM